MKTFLVSLGALPVALGLPSFANIGHGSLSGFTSLPKLSKFDIDSPSLLKPNHLTWTPPSAGDLRAPCPGLNTLANHGFIPHDGRNITSEIVQKGFKDAMNIDEALSAAAFKPALELNPGASFINLDMLHKHNFIEHDGSLSRRDMYFDPSNRFDKETFDAFIGYFGGATTINITTIANARARHALEMSRVNPNFTLPESAIPAATGECAFLLTIFGTPGTPVANRSYVEFFFRNERLPVELGWAPVDTPITLSPTIQQIANEIVAQTPSDVPLVYAPKGSG
ncbi:putative sterigmatocystin biosynthesis peroxidase stcC [Colletotrichum higginsianum]|uniref:Putative sterigmatocystin biosynthesis peroxidase stcC n=1 Tax=Colletotrichum higginsianum TaxID=80884 RepID=A0A4T0WKF7_9PEZI|nr:putative sterigmatocystin biosynthesis peroxidase stcC [Colletotrichum higginsianum]